MTTQGTKGGSHVVTVTWGKCDYYSPRSNEPFVWNGSLSIEKGGILSLDQLHCQRAEFGRP